MPALQPHPGATPIDRADIRVGDTIEQHLQGYVVRTTVTRIDSAGYFWNDIECVAGHLGGPWYLIDRPAPQLPTESGSVIADVTVGTERYEGGLLSAMWGWRLFRNGEIERHVPLDCLGDITAWTPAKIVTDGEPVTR